MNTLRGYRHLVAAICVASAVLVDNATAAEPTPEPSISTVTLDIATQPLGDALNQFAQQTGLQMVFYPEIAEGFTSPRLAGSYSPQRALTQLLANTQLVYEFINPRTVAIRMKGSTDSHSSSSSIREDQNADRDVLQLADAKEQEEIPSQHIARVEGQGDDSAERTKTEDAKSSEKISELLLVHDSRILNTDIPRSQDDAQPYVIIDHETLQRSGVVDLGDFLKKRLTMNTQGISPSQGPGALGNTSQVNLRGLGVNQTLILIDGRRTASVVLAGTPYQANINGIPLAAIERIEILPTTASGIFGGSATGGAINVILRRDYAGAESQLSYGTHVDGGPSQQKVDLSGGIVLEGGKTSALLSASYLDTGELLFGDRSFIQRSRDRISENNPDGLLIGVVPPLGSTPNIRSLDGSPLFGPDTPNFTFVPSGYTSGDGLAPLQANAGHFNLDLPDAAHDYAGGLRSLLPSETTKSVMTTLRRQFSTAVDAFVEASASRQHTDFRVNAVGTSYLILDGAPNNPFANNIVVSVPLKGADDRYTSDIDNYRAVGGVIVHLPRNWSAEADYSWGHFVLQSTNPRVALSSLFVSALDGTLDLLRDVSAFPPDLEPYLAPREVTSPQRSTSKNVSLRMAGPIFSLPAGSVVMSSLIEHRSDFIDRASTRAWDEFLSSYQDFSWPNRSQSIDSAYVEITTPLVSDRNHMRGIRELELQVAARHDEYKVNGVTNFVTPDDSSSITRTVNRTRSTDPTVALRYKPLPDMMLRVSYGTGFLPPNVQQIVPSLFPGGGTFQIVDPKRNEVIDLPTTTVRSGGNPDLKPELSESWSIGTVLTPRVIQGLRLSVDYTHIDKTDNITSPFSGVQDLVNNEDLVPDRIIRGVPSGGDSVGPIIGLNNTLFNIAKAEVEAYDVMLDYRLDTSRFGSFDFHALSTWQTHYKTQLIATAPVVENVGITYVNPLKFKGNAGVTWQRNSWMLGWWATYFDSYLASTDPAIQLSQGDEGRVPSQLYHDLLMSYTFNNGSTPALLKDVEVQLNIENIFNKIPPVDLGADYIYYSTFADPRLRGFRLSVRKAF